MSEPTRSDYLNGLLAEAADRFSARLRGKPAFGIGARTIGRTVDAAGQRRWLRVACDRPEWAGGPTWEGNRSANAIDGVPKPRVLDVVEWDADGIRVRAELQTFAPGAALAGTIAAPADLRIDDEQWWTTLHDALVTLADQPTNRICMDPRLTRDRIRAFFGAEVDSSDLTRTTAHGDLHWANLTGPPCWLLDWEAWGTAPAGYDAASLLCASLTNPPLAERIREQFADMLDSPTGRVAQLAAAAKLLGFVEHGQHPDLAAPLHEHARTLVREQVP